jgi:hypothetical protein
MITENDPVTLRAEGVERLIHIIRGQRVMLDSDLAAIYGVTTKHLNQQIRRNLDRFPTDFAFQVSREEFEIMRSQFVTASKRNIRHLPWAFTEHGAIMLASVLNSPLAIQASLRVVRAFVYLREQLTSTKELARKFAELEQRLDTHDESIATLFEAIRQLLEPAETDQPRREIGFHVKEQARRYRVALNTHP